jgi:hypothetical protein
MTYAVFKMWDERRQSLVKRHEFYVEQARKRLLSQFDNMEAEADEAAEKWLEESGRYFDPDRHDPGDFYEQAGEERNEFYRLLEDMRENTRLSVVAGMYHEWDKHLRGWLAREIERSIPGGNAAAKIWAANFDQIIDLLESLGWSLRSTDFFGKLDACRLVVNVYKHGKGSSLDDLKARFLEYFTDLYSGIGGGFSNIRYRDHTHLKVSDEQLQEFSDAIVSFWMTVPEDIYDTDMGEVPDWFGKAVLKDQATRKQSGKGGPI